MRSNSQGCFCWWGTVTTGEFFVQRLSLLPGNHHFVLLCVFLALSSAGPGVSSMRNSNSNYHPASSSTQYDVNPKPQQSDRRPSVGQFQGNQFPRRTSTYVTHNENIKNNNTHNHLSNYYNHVLNLNLTFLQDFELGCPQYCAEQSQFHYNSVCINQGCKQWKTGLRGGCNSACSGTEGNFREHYGCQVGCSKAIEDYYFRITGLLGVVDPPTLVLDSLNSTSLQLSWEGSYPELPYLVFTIQRRLYRRNHQWETISTQPLNQTWFTVQGLTPYTEYQFRIGWILAQDFPPFYSQESNPIETLPEGLPNPPEITSIQPISNTSVSVTWIPPSQPNGRLVAYILTLQKLPDGHAIIKEIPIVNNPRGYTFSGLSPNTNYSLSISAQNQEGVGNATNSFFVTPQSSMSNDMSKRPEPRLLLQGAHDVFLQKTDLLLSPDVIVYAPGQSISAIAAHIEYKWAFVATVDGQVVRTSLETNQTMVIFPRGKLDIDVSFMSIDWLHNKLFLVGQMRQSSHWAIKRCELGGEGLITIYPFLGSEPTDFLADPFTGYLYWVTKIGPRRNVSGLYKMDMLSETSAPIPVLESERGELGPFTIDFTTYRILVVHKSKNTVLSVSLDGDTTDIRKNTRMPQFFDALSIGLYNGLLYLATGSAVVVEEYSSRDDTFYQNRFDLPRNHQPCTRLMIIHPDLQPVPVPMAPPQMPQLVMGTRQARVSWRPPAVIAGLGKDAWTSWKYQIIVSDNRSVSDVTGTQYLLKNLKPSATYSVRVLAYSASGHGPSSPTVQGKTLRETSYNVSLIWASATGIYSTDVLGDSVHKLVPAVQWASSVGRHNPYISSLAWHKGSSLYFALSNGSVFHYDADRSTPKVTQVLGVSYAQSIAYDYIGQKLYWSNPKQQMILRCNAGACDHSSEKMEWLHIITMAKEIAVDSMQGILVWNTGHTLEACRMNSYSRTDLYQTGLFSGVQITGFTLDSDLPRAYFVTRSSSGSDLWKLGYDLRRKQKPTLITRLTDANLLGPIKFFNDRILCLQGTAQSMLLDVTTKTRATLTLSSLSNVTSIHVRDEYSRRFSRHNIQVVPNSVPAWTIKIQGKWDNFVISWQNVTNVNMGKLYYEVVVNNTISRVTASPSIAITDGIFRPFSEIEISITASSYWASSEPIVVKRQTPSAKPSEPKNVRAFTERLSPVYKRAMINQRALRSASGEVEDAETVVAELRWDQPENPNGKILGYVIHCWKDGVKRSNCSCDADIKQLRCQVKNLPRNSTYLFAVQAYTDEGAGGMSRNVTANLEFDYPVERMLLTTSDKLQIFDVDRNSIQTIALGALNPVSSAYSAVDESVYWINEGQDLMVSSLNAGNKTRILSLTNYGDGSHLTYDWIGRRLFWAMEFPERDPKFAIMALDLTAIESVKNATPVVIRTSQTAIKGLTVDPFRSVILWTTSKRNGVTTIYSSRTDGSDPMDFLSRDHINCNCSNCSVVGEPVTFDSSGFGSMKRGVLMTNDKSIYLTDETGCDCVPLINMTAHGFSWSRTPPYKLAGNQRHIFWSAGYIYASAKPGSGVTELMPSGVREISILGPSSQPFPDLRCLVPSKLSPEVPLLLNQSSYSIHLRLPAVEFSDCEYEDISLAALKYSVFYGAVNENRISECTPTSLSHCMNVTTSATLLELNDLAPYTIYTVFVSVTNIYREVEGLDPLACSPTMFQTSAGAPMPPKLLRLEPLTPESVRVVWRRPLKLNGEKVWYEINWSPEKRQISPGPGWTEVEVKNGFGWYDSKNNDSATEFHWTIKSLHPACNYHVWVSAYSEKGDAFSSSDNQTIRTYPNPSNVTLLSTTPHILNLKWEPPSDTSIASYQIHYRVGWESKWNWTEPVNTSQLIPPYNFSIVDLKPNTVYGFKVKAWYTADMENPYYWPKDQNQFMIETLADKPGAPGKPMVKSIGRDMYEVVWNPAENNGATVEYYILECRMDVEIIVPQDKKEKGTGLDRDRRQSGNEVIAQKLVSNEKQEVGPVKYARWVQVYNGTEPRWQVENLDHKLPYAFRVRAKNSYGWGEYSEAVAVDSLILLAPGVAEPQPLGIILGTVGSSLVILSVFGSILLFVYKKKVKEEPTLQSPSSSERREVELATLRELPGGSSFIHQSNILYAASDLVLDIELAGIAQIGRNQISFTKFLGSGAFGEVYEGTVADLDDSGDTKVAIKTLPKGASANKKLEFIEEAKLMTHFRHPNILQLLGICIDTDPCCLVLELMEGGDLLSYLRANRPDLGSSVVLRMPDLLRMCVDVAKGCVYLEERHFVHRDLAARNCLVRLVNSAENEGGQERVVKIGDFGLARDVYRNDYYRKEGGLLPVRWMAPESLIDGVYTTQSDVWSFGVLLWEIMTMGQQPYPARNNIEVWHYVRNGGRLQQPPRCPPRLSQLMLRCWEFNADNRPTFRDCLNDVEQILREFECGLEQGDHISAIEARIMQLHQYNNYLQPGSDSKSSYYRQVDGGTFPQAMNVAYAETAGGEGIVYADTGAVGSLSFPKYLQIVGDSSGREPTQTTSLPFSNTDEGYEIPLPRKPPRNPQLSSRRTDQNIPSDLGLPSPSYWNTMQETQQTFQHQQPLEVSPPNQDYSSNSSPSQSTQYELASPAKAKDKYVRRTNEDFDYSLNSPTHFRNLLASTTSEDADMDGELDYSENEFGSPTGAGNVFRDYDSRPSGIEDAVQMSRPRKKRFPVSLSDSSNGSGDTSACTDEAEAARSCESNENELQTDNPEYLSMMCAAGNLSRLNNINNNSSKYGGYLQQPRGDDVYLTNGFIYDDAMDLRFSSVGEDDYTRRSPPPVGYQY